MANQGPGAAEPAMCSRGDPSAGVQHLQQEHTSSRSERCHERCQELQARLISILIVIDDNTIKMALLSRRARRAPAVRERDRLNRASVRNRKHLLNGTPRHRELQNSPNLGARSSRGRVISCGRTTTSAAR